MSPSRHRTIHVALVGNPNTGKSTLFNSLTGMRQRMGNYPGVTVEKKVGAFALGERRFHLVDLPGCYSLAATSLDERVVLDVLLGEMRGERAPDLVVVVVDASNIQRNLFLCAQVAELGLPMVVALNLWDAALKMGIEIDAPALSARLGVPVIPTVASRGTGLDELRAAIVAAIDAPARMARIEWPEAVARAAAELRETLGSLSGHPVREVVAYRLLFDARSSLRDSILARGEEISTAIEQARRRVRHAGYSPGSVEAVLQHRRLGALLEGIARSAPDMPPRASESIDRLLTHPFWGMVCFAAMMWVVFQSVYTWSLPAMAVIESLAEAMRSAARAWLAATPVLASLVADGIVGGVGGVLIFLPQILVLFLFVGLLEDTGYMARAAFLMDRSLGWCGLNGKSFVPLLSSYACAVPGVMAARVIEDPRARLTTIFIAPLMSCSARLPVYVLFIGAFIEPRYGPVVAGWTLFAMHFVGLAVALPSAWLLNRVVLRARRHPFLLEMSPYRIPVLRHLLWRIWESAQEFVVRAGSIILAFSIVIWALLYFPRPPDVERRARETFLEAEAARSGQTPAAVAARVGQGDEELAGALHHAVEAGHVEQSWLGRFGRFIQPAFELAGFDWKIAVGILSSFPARETVIATLGIVYSLGGDVDEDSVALRDAMARQTWSDGPRAGQPIYSVPVVVAILAFFALCLQCGATVAVMARESNWGWALAAFVYMTALAWGAAVACYQIGIRLCGLSP